MRNPKAWLTTLEDSRWSFVDWFNDKPYRLPGIVGMAGRPNGIEYVYHKRDKSVVQFTLNHLDDTLFKFFTPESVRHFLGSDNDSESSDENMPAEGSDSKELEAEGYNNEDEWGLYSVEQFCNVTLRVVVRETNQAVSLLDWICGQSDFCIYIKDMWMEGNVLWVKAERAIDDHVRAWTSQIVTQARVLLTNLSY